MSNKMVRREPYAFTFAKSVTDAVNLETELYQIQDVYRKLKESLTVTRSTEGLSDAQIRDLKLGKTCFLPASLVDGHRTKESVRSVSFLKIDLDEVVNLDILERIEKLPYAYFYYTTFSHTPEAPRVRILLPLDEDIKSDGTRASIQIAERKLEAGVRHVCELLEETDIDKASWSIAQPMQAPIVPENRKHYFKMNRNYYGPKGFIEIEELFDAAEEQRILEEQAELEERRLAAEERRRERETRKAKGEIDANTLSYEEAMDELKSIDLGDYLRDMGIYGAETTRSGIKMACPIHNEKKGKSFSTYQKNGEQRWSCFGKCRAGGSIIDLHMELEHVDQATAIRELLEMYNIEFFSTKQALSVKGDTYFIDKYISNNKVVTKAIIDAVEKYMNVLVTGALGAGKTHFVLNDLYQYAKSKGKALIMVTSSKKQLEYLCEKKGIAINYEHAKWDGEADLVVSTPESLADLAERMGMGKFILVVDEAHEKIMSLYREGYRLEIPDSVSKLAYKTLSLSATPRLLMFDNSIDKIITIKSKEVIRNKVSILRCDKEQSQQDRKRELIKGALDEGKQVVLFNNCKTKNTKIAKEVKRDNPSATIEVVKSESYSENVAKGVLKEDVTITTTAINAGIDLELVRNGVLFVDMSHITIDQLTQLIGRFRAGIEVCLLTQIEEEEPAELVSLDNWIANSMNISLSAEREANKRAKITTMYDGEGSVAGNANIRYRDGKWELDRYTLIASVYKKWNNIFRNSAKILSELLKSNTAFEIDGDIEIIDAGELQSNRMEEESKQEAKRKKQVIEKVSAAISELDDGDITTIIATRDTTELEHMASVRFEPKGVTLKDIEEYKELAGRDIDKVKEYSKAIFTNERTGAYSSGAGFKVFYSRLKKETDIVLKRLEVAKVNKFIEEHGIDYYLSAGFYGVRHSIEVVTAKIRSELLDIERSRGRVTDKRLEALTDLLVKDGYLVSPAAKKYKDKSKLKKEEQEALKCKLIKKVFELVSFIYNLKSNENRISSLNDSPAKIIRAEREYLKSIKSLKKEAV